MRTLDERVLLEACVENATQKPLQLVQVKCETLPGVKADPVHHSAYEQTGNARPEVPDAWPNSYADRLQVCP